MKFKNIEKKIYELLGVNIFRKYILFTYDKLWKLLGGAPGYRIKNKTINGIEHYKFQTKAFAIAHFISLIFIIGLSHRLQEFHLILPMIINSYCIITQRYNCIRINEILEKHKELEERRKERHKELEKRREERHKELEKRRESKIEAEMIICNYIPLYQSEEVDEQGKTSSSTEIYCWGNSFESLEQKDSNTDTGFRKVLKK